MDSLFRIFALKRQADDGLINGSNSTIRHLAKVIVLDFDTAMFQVLSMLAHGGLFGRHSRRLFAETSHLRAK
jgi:hypothetical protein